MDTTTLVGEFEYRTARSTGAGGQHVNKTESKVEVLWHVERSQALSASQKYLLRQNLQGRINAQGYISVIEQSDRSQVRNKILGTAKMTRLIAAAIVPIVKRKVTVMPPAIKNAIRKEKAQRSSVKALRRRPLRDFDSDGLD
jgi:ribosome-associated protein